MRKAGFLLLFAALVVVVLTCAGQELFQGQLEVLDFKAPEFPPPAEQMPSTRAAGVPGAPSVPLPGATSTPPGMGAQPQAQPETQPPLPNPIGTDAYTTPVSDGIYWINSRPLSIHKLRGK